MNDYIFLMYQAPEPINLDWSSYFAQLRSTGQFAGGSSIGDGLTVSKSGASQATSKQLVGYIRVSADSLENARALLVGNPVYEAGGVVEIRELPKSG
ncbi:MAG TPA: hypothetical protein VM576_07190 [Xanthomonadaceae bacterium]|nr:hypothetical protein [Xanthomonadaceae bacterium]